MRHSLRRTGAPPLIWALAAIFCAFEGLFILAEAGILPVEDLRWRVYLLGAFWDVLYEAALAGEAVPFTFWTSWISHAFLHGGLFHLAMNTTVFLALGGYVAHGIGTLRFLVLFLVTAIAGALFFAILSDARGPMVGASGVLFGLIGALKFWEWRYIQITGAPANRFWGTIIGLVLLNVVLAFFFPGGGDLAWQAHLGGFVGGFLIAPVLAPGAAGPSPI